MTPQPTHRSFLNEKGECGHPKLSSCKKCGSTKFKGNKNVYLLMCENCDDGKWNNFYVQIDIDRFHAEAIREALDMIEGNGMYKAGRAQIDAVLKCMEGKQYGKKENYIY